MKKIIVFGAIISVMLTFGCSKKVNSSAFLQFVIGDVKIVSNNKNIEPVVGMAVVSGMVIKTGDKSLASVQIGSQTLLKIAENSTIDLTNILSSKKINLYLNEGKVLINVSKLQKKDMFNVKTPVAVAAVRGTKFSVAYSKYKKNSVVAVVDGKVEVSSSIDKVKTKLVKVDEAVVVKDEIKSREITKKEYLELDKVKDENIIKSSEIIKIKELKDELIKKDNTIQKELDKSEEKDVITLDTLKEKYGRIDEVTLYSGKKYFGVIVKRGKFISLVTPNGTVKIEKSKIAITGTR